MDEIKAGPPAREGTQSNGRFERDARRAQTVQQPRSFGDLARDYRLFNHGCLFTHGGLDKDPLVNFVARNPGVAIVVLLSPKRLFAGLVPADGATYGHWAYRLFGVAYEHWEAVENEIRLCAWVDRTRNTFGRATIQEIEIVDPFVVGHLATWPAVLSTVKVTVFGVDATWTHVVFASDVTHPQAVARIIHLPIREETRTLGAAYLAGSQTPFRSIEPEDPFEGIQGIVPPAFD